MGLDGRPSKKRKTSNEINVTKPRKEAKSSISFAQKNPKTSQKKKPPKKATQVHSLVTNDSKAPINTKKRLVVVAGSYERVLYGLQIDPQGQVEQESCSFEPLFMFPAHISCVKAVAASPQGGKWLATGGTDETIKIWDLRRKKELGSLQQHQGSITYLSFPTRSHLLSTAEDGTIYLYHTRDWAVLATLNGHRDRVNDLAVHPSAKVCLSVGKDRTLRMWDLMRGKGSSSVKLGKEGERVQWTPSGTRFAVVSGSNIDIYSTKMALLQTIAHPARIHDISFCRTNADRDVLLVAAEDKQVTIYLLPQAEAEDSAAPVIGYLSGHMNRVKALDLITIQNATFAATVSSDGRIHLYDLTAVLNLSDVAEREPLDVAPIAVYDTKGSRLTCVTITERGEGPDQTESKKRKHSAESDEASDEDEDDMSEPEVGI